jgi:hypothetical protein
LLVQPHAPEMHAWPISEAVQSLQVPPAAPHAVWPEPAAQLPPEQQAPLHGDDGEQLDVHRWVMLLQA